MDSAQKTEIAGVQYMRAAAALIVVYFHTTVYNAQFGWPDWLPRGFGAAGVDMFFVISGFIMMLVTAGRPMSPRDFLQRRVIRIVPLYWTVTLLVAAIGLAYPAVMLQNEVSARHLLLSMFFLPHANPVTGSITPFYKLGWTLNYEMYFYVLFAALLLLRSPRSRLLALVAYACAVSAVFLATDPQVAVVRVYTNPIIGEFVLGAAVGYGYSVGWVRRVPVGAAVLCMVTGGAALLTLPVEDATRTVLQGIASALVLVGVLGLEDRGRLPRLGWLLLLGDASYSIYLAHPIVESVFRVGSRMARLPVDHPVLGPMLAILAVGASLVAGVLIYRFAEVPLLAAMKPKGGRAPLPAAAAGPVAISGAA